MLMVGLWGLPNLDQPYVTGPEDKDGAVHEPRHIRQRRKATSFHLPPSLLPPGKSPKFTHHWPLATGTRPLPSLLLLLLLSLRLTLGRQHHSHCLCLCLSVTKPALQYCTLIFPAAFYALWLLSVLALCSLLPPSEPLGHRDPTACSTNPPSTSVSTARCGPSPPPRSLPA